MTRLALLALVACGGHAAAPRPAVRAVPESPGARLPDGVAPLGYDLRLELDPDRDAFAGHVVIRVRVRDRDHVWLNSSGLAVTAASWRRGAELHPLPVVATGDELQAFDLGARVTGEIELDLAYTGHTGKDEEGLFRQQDRGRWYLYSQSESVFARRFVPCFDEPRFKVPWQVAIVAPADLAAFGNAAQASTVVLPDGRRETRFAITPPLSSYLLAVAVGPFAIVDAGRAGAVPLRAIMLAGDEDRAGVVAAKVPEMLAALEAYAGSPLPWPKLDFVAVPHLFGAMENPGLITFNRDSLAGDAHSPWFASHFVRIAGHELAHMWFGNSVTPAWWDDLWLAEAFAQWMADKLASQLHAFGDEPLQLGLAREQALIADDAIDARPLHHAVSAGIDAEGQFDAISYEKGAALLASFERLAGEAAFRAAIRSYLGAHAGGTATTADLIAALAAAVSPAIAHALAVDVELAGTPIANVAASCDGAPKLVASARNGIVPLCVRTGAHPTCALVGDRTEIPLPADAACAAIVGNAAGRGYYDTVETSAASLAPGEALAHGDDIAAMLRRGELDAKRAAAELLRMAAGDVYAQLGALAIARALEPAASGDPAAFARWLAKPFAARLTPAALFAPRGDAERALRDALIELAQLPALPTADLERSLAQRATIGDALQAALSAPAGSRALFDRVVDARGRSTGDTRAAFEDALGSFGADLAPHAIELVAHGDLPLAIATAYFARPVTRVAAWAAVRAHLAELLAIASPQEAKDLVAATGGLCAARAEVAAAFEPRVADLLDGRRTLARSLATIDRCIARRASAGTFP